MSCEELAFRLPLIFNECIYTQRDFAAFLFGYTSISFWLFAQIPQLLKNWRLKQYINIKFILIWLMGDICNLLGSRLTDQKPFQVYLAAYFVIIDTCLLSQCVYYRRSTEEVVMHRSSSLSPSLLSPLLLASPISAFQLVEYRQDIGTIISWICCCLYLTSRLPQILSNYKLKSVQSLSMEMFACALMGNITYSISLLLTWKSSNVPFFLGSVGTIGLDLFVFAQYFVYKENNIHAD